MAKSIAWKQQSSRTRLPGSIMGSAVLSSVAFSKFSVPLLPHL